MAVNSPLPSELMHAIEPLNFNLFDTVNSSLDLYVTWVSVATSSTPSEISIKWNRSSNEQQAISFLSLDVAVGEYKNSTELGALSDMTREEAKINSFSTLSF